jgi:hypothetical protein
MILQDSEVQSIDVQLVDLQDSENALFLLIFMC